MADNLLTAVAPAPTFRPRQIALFFFKPCLDEEGDATDYYACKACGKCRKHTPRAGYTNLVSHVRNAHPNYESDMRAAIFRLRLQATGLTLLDARDLSDGLLEIRPSFAKYLASDADIVHSIVFEEAVVKVLAGQTPLLTENEVSALEPFKRQRSSILGSGVPPSTKEGFAERILKRRKSAVGAIRSKDDEGCLADASELAATSFRDNTKRDFGYLKEALLLVSHKMRWSVLKPQLVQQFALMMNGYSFEE
ncbi:hypothetical protein PRNP1_011108 [Phytophthora ramorum]